MSLDHTIDTFTFSLGVKENGFLFHKKCNEEESSYIGSDDIFDTPVFFDFETMVDLSRNKYTKRSSKYATNLNYFNLISYNTSYIMKNPIYANFSIKPNHSRKRVNLLVIVTSAPSRIERRNAIRDTWWKSCRNNTKVHV